MLTRFLGGVAACLAAAGGLAAQQPTTPSDPSPVPAPPSAGASASRPGIYPAVNGSPRRMPAARLVAAPADSAAPTTLPAPSGMPTGLLTSVPRYADCDCPGGACQPAAPSCAQSCLCGPPGKFWVDAGWIFWATKGQNLPPLVTSAPAGTARTNAGVLGDPSTSVLYGGGTANNGFRSGLYLNAGMWLNQSQTCGIEGNFFFLGQNSKSFSAGNPAGTDPSNIVTRPFTNALTGAGDTELVSFPGVLSGTVGVTSKTNVIGGGVNFLKNLCCDPCGRFDLLLGYQYFNLRDEVNIQENLTSLPGATNVTPGTTFLVQDQFKTSNNFHGANIGFTTERRFGDRFFAGLRTGVALGVNHMTYDVNGSTTITPPGGPATTYAGGLLTQPSNIGHYTQNKFAVMPMVGLKVGAQLTDHVRAYVGYDFVYLSTAARAGDQIDLRVNTSQIPPRTNGVTGPALPAFSPQTTDFWMQGVRVGLEVRF